MNNWNKLIDRKSENCTAILQLIRANSEKMSLIEQRFGDGPKPDLNSTM